MRLTRRGWAIGLAGLSLVGLGHLAARPLLLVGGGLIGAWLLASQVQFVLAVLRTVDNLTVEQRPQFDRFVADQEVPISFYAGLSKPSILSLTIEGRFPPGTKARQTEGRYLDLDPGEDQALGTVHVRWPHAGNKTLEPPSVTLRDSSHYFEVSIPVGLADQITVEPRAPRNLHIGTAGEPITAGFGQHRGEAYGAGIEPAELRPYTPGDAANRIDWKATARLTEAHVREFEIETDRRTVLVVDQRPSMADGSPGERKIDFAREIALAILESARRNDNPLTCLTFDESGQTAQMGPDAERHHYARVRAHLSSLEPRNGPPGRVDRRRPAIESALTRADRLPDGNSTFLETLHAYSEGARPEPSGHDPLIDSLRSTLHRMQGAAWTVLLVDDTEPQTLRRAVRIARRGEGKVNVYLTPTGLFYPGGLADLEQAYDQYLSFEELRRSLDRLDRVSAFEVAPGDRLDAVLAAGRERYRARGER